MALLIVFERLGVLTQMILEALCVMLVSLFCGPAQQYGLKHAFVKQQQEVGGDRECSEFAYDMESLLGSFMEFIVSDELLIFEVVDLQSFV